MLLLLPAPSRRWQCAKKGEKRHADPTSPHHSAGPSSLSRCSTHPPTRLLSLLESVIGWQSNAQMQKGEGGRKARNRVIRDLLVQRRQLHTPARVLPAEEMTKKHNPVYRKALKKSRRFQKCYMWPSCTVGKAWPGIGAHQDSLTDLPIGRSVTLERNEEYCTVFVQSHGSFVAFDWRLRSLSSERRMKLGCGWG
jgi:hypothetical protein